MSALMILWIVCWCWCCGCCSCCCYYDVMGLVVAKLAKLNRKKIESDYNFFFYCCCRITLTLLKIIIIITIIIITKDKTRMVAVKEINYQNSKNLKTQRKKNKLETSLLFGAKLLIEITFLPMAPHLHLRFFFICTKNCTLNSTKVLKLIYLRNLFLFFFLICSFEKKNSKSNFWNRNFVVRREQYHQTTTTTTTSSILHNSCTLLEMIGVRELSFWVRIWIALNFDPISFFSIRLKENASNKEPDH